MPGSFNIRQIHDGAGPKQVIAKPMLEVSVDGTAGLSIEGDLVGANTVCCTLTRYQHDVARQASMWTRHLHCRVVGGKWTVKTGRLEIGYYVLAMGDQAQGVQCVFVNVVATGAATDKNIASITPLMSITNVNKGADHIIVTGACLFPAEYIHGSLTAIDNSGVIIPGTVTSFKNTVASFSSPYTWNLPFLPADLGQMSFAGLYSFTGVSYDGTVSRTIEVP